LRLWDILRTRLRSLFFRDRRESDLSEELQGHLDRETERLRSSGLSPDAARLQALRTFGGVEQVREECRDARGTAFVDDTVRDVFYALRTFKRAPLVAFTIVSTVGLGLGLVAVAFTMLNMLLFNVDQVPNVDEMFAIERPRTGDGERGSFTRAEWDALRRESDVFTDAYAELSGTDFRVDGRVLLFTLVTGNFFQVTGVNAAMGRMLMAADDEPFAGRAVMVLSDRGWERLFGRDPAILGRTVLVNGFTFEIVGVMPRGFRGLSVVPPDYWVPLSMVAHIRPIDRGREANVGVRVVGRLKPGMSRQSAQAGLAVWAASQPDARPITRGEPGITLIPWQGTVPQPLEAVLVTGPLFFAFGLILLIGCANVANLLLARSVARQREIGIRLSLGAARGRIVRQLLTESLLLALVAAAAGYAVSRVALQGLVNAMLTSWPPEIGDIQLLVPESDWRVSLFLIVGGAVSALFFGLVPALQATRIEPVRSMRGEIVRDARPGRARDFLIGVQVSASALLLICAAVFLRSAFAAATADPGLRTSDTIVIQIANEVNRTAMVQAVAAEPSVAAIAASWPGPLGALRAAFAEAAGEKAAVACKFVSPEFFGVLDIAVVQGRAFAPDERLPSLPVAVVSETTARALWPRGDAVGQTLRLDPEAGPDAGRDDEPRLESRTVAVVGVVRDVAGFRLAPAPKAMVYLPASTSMPRTALVARVHGDPERARAALVKRLTMIDPAVEQGGMEMVGTIAWVIRMETYLLQIGFWFTVGLGGLALALTLSGLFSVLSYLVEQRTREIGVRMALGATTWHVTRLVLSQSFRPVAAGLIIGAVLAGILSASLLATPAAGIIGQIVDVLDPVAYTVSVLIIVAACLGAAAVPASRAARLDPTRALRED
jgi:predicted permease